MSDEIRSIIHTQHPDLAHQVRDAIQVMERVLEIAGPLPQGNLLGPPPGILHTAHQDIGATTDSTSLATDRPKSQPRQNAVVLAAGEAFGRYQIVKLLGKGAMGAVYLAYDSRLERHVAIKTPFLRGSPVVLERFYIEARATATLRSPNICPVYDVEQINGVHYISMAFIEGQPLSKLIDAGPLTPVEAATILSKTAKGIQKAHERGIVHRDLKPDNIMIDVDGEPVVMDFGLAWRNDSGDARLTQDGALLGSPAYMSPEQAMGKQELIGPATDIYSLGVVLYHMLTQHLPFQGPIVSVLRMVAHDTPHPPSTHVPALANTEIERICLKMMEKSPSNRFPCMGDVFQAAEALRAPGASERGKPGKWRFWPFK